MLRSVSVGASSREFGKKHHSNHRHPVVGLEEKTKDIFREAE